MIKNSLRTLALISLAAGALHAEKVPLYKGYINSSYDSAKNSIMGGATTATAKGYAALSSNPAGLSTNYNFTLYTKTLIGTSTVTSVDSQVEYDVDPGDHISVGLMYDSFAVEYKVDDYMKLGAAYGYESRYGLFSFGLSYTMEETDMASTSALAKDEFATGDYLTYGLMWQKTFLDEDDFYAVYLGYSYKNSGKYTGDIPNDKTVPVSPSRRNFGLGLETNLFNGSILFTFDNTEEFWQTVNQSLSGSSYGLKWMMGHKFAIGGGISDLTFSGETHQNIETTGVGIEWGFLGMHLMPSYTMRTLNSENFSVEDEVFHLDIAFTF